MNYKGGPGFVHAGFSSPVLVIVTVEAALVYNVEAYRYRLRWIV